MPATAAQREVYELQQQGLTRQEIADRTGRSLSAVKHLLARYHKWADADSALADAGKSIGADTPPSLTWAKQQADGTVLYSSMFSNRPEPPAPEEYAEALRDELQKLPRLEPLGRAVKSRNGKCNFIPLADLHLGGRYGDTKYIEEVLATADDLISRLPQAEEAKLIELGDLLDANDHKGVTPASGNPCDVRRDNHLENTITAVRVMDHIIQRLLEDHHKVEVHLLRGNHDETAYIAVMMTLAERFRDNPAVEVVVTDEPFRVVSWGRCAVFPHHGDKAKWEALKGVFTDQFSDEWAAAEAARFIWTAHFHHDRGRDLGAVYAEHFRTTYPANKWAREKGLFNLLGLCAVTLHKDFGEVYRTKAKVYPR